MVKSFGSVCIISAPSGTGKSTLIQAVQKTNFLFFDIYLFVSYTTRKRRPGEIHGKDYYFVSIDEFQDMIKSDMFFEYAMVHNNYYGIKKSNMKKLLQSGLNIILDIDWQGAQKIRDKIPCSYTIFILPPSKIELDRRLCIRGQDSPQVISDRMHQAVNEIYHFREYDYIIVNDNFNVALCHLKSIIISEQLRLIYQKKRYSELIYELLS